MNNSIASLISEYKKKRRLIKSRLKDFKDRYKGADKDIFSELCFCILTPQSNARYCDRAIRELKKTDLLFKGKSSSIKSILKGKARFHNKKADYIINARKCFDRNIFDSKNVLEIRDSLVKNIKGFGYKEASHFLRNVGMGRNIAILDRHILKNLKRCGAIKKIPSSISAKGYLDMEARARQFAKKIKIPLEELDLLFWSHETGEIFK